MQFPTVTFVIFFAAVLSLTWALHSRLRVRRFALIAAGAAFYGFWDARFLALLATMIVLTWGVGWAISRTAAHAQSAIMTLGIALDVLLLAFFKYYGFFTTSLASALSHLGLHVHPPLLQIAVPIGVSFYTFQAISYLIEVRRQRVQAASLIDVAAWLSFFPTITSGPIVRASEFLPQLGRTPTVSRDDLGRAYLLIVRGLLKKLALASFFATAITDRAFASPEGLSSVTLLIAVYAYAAQIYCDFSGYTDMAIGLALLIGLRLPENFDRPYTATSIQDFWARWHMTLSRWLRDYLFAPMARSRRHAVSVYLSIVAVMLIAGLWHGAAWGFVVFGGVHGAAMAIERRQRDRRRRERRAPSPHTPGRQLLRRVLTFHIVCLGWIFFATPSLSGAGHLLRGIATNWTTPVTLLTPLLLLGIGAVIAVQYVPSAWVERAVAGARRWPPAAQAVAFAVATIPVLAMSPTTVPAFIYYRF